MQVFIHVIVLDGKKERHFMKQIHFFIAEFEALYYVFAKIMSISLNFLLHC